MGLLVAHYARPHTEILTVPKPSAFRAIAIKLSIPHHAAILGCVPIETKQLASMTITQDADLRLQARPLFKLGRNQIVPLRPVTLKPEEGFNLILLSTLR